MRRKQRQQQQSVPLDKFNVSFTIQYGNELSQRESEPMLFCYLSSPIVTNGVEIPLPVDDADQQIRVNVEGCLPRGVQLPVDAQLVFYATCLKENQFGTPCRVDAGFATLPIAAIWSSSASSGFNEDLSLRLKSSGNIEKGRLRVRSGRHMMELGSQIRWETADIGSAISVWRASSSVTAEVGGPLREEDLLPVEKECLSNINQVMQTEMSFPNTFPQTANVKIPIYYGDVGMMRPCPLPAAAYFMYKTPKSNRMFWENNLKTVLARTGHVINDVKHMTLTEKSTVLADMICYLVQSMDYISDLVDGNRRFIKGSQGFIESTIGQARDWDPTQVSGCERFGDALRDGTGDCEDFGLAEGQTFSAFKEADFKDHPILAELQDIAHQYVAIMTLDTVTAAAARAEDQEKKMGAHIKCNMFPKYYFNQCIQKGRKDMMGAIKTGRLNHPAQAAAVIGNSIETSDRVLFTGLKPYGKDLPFLVLEGTGMFLPYGLENDPIQNERNVVYKGMPSLGFCKKPIVHPPGAPSTFFEGSMVGFSAEWFESSPGVNLCGMWLGYSGVHSEKAGTFQRGVHFTDLINKSEKISIIMHPEFSDSCMAWMKKATAIRVPPRDLILTEEGIANFPKREPTIDKLVKFTDGMQRPLQYRNQDPALVYMKTSQLNRNNVHAIMNDIEKNPYISRMTYVPEYGTDWSSWYRVGIHANVAN